MPQHVASVLYTSFPDSILLRLLCEGLGSCSRHAPKISAWLMHTDQSGTWEAKTEQVRESLITISRVKECSLNTCTPLRAHVSCQAGWLARPEALQNLPTAAR